MMYYIMGKKAIYNDTLFPQVLKHVIMSPSVEKKVCNHHLRQILLLNIVVLLLYLLYLSV